MGLRRPSRLLFLASSLSFCQTSVPPAYTITTIAGTNFVGDGGRATSAQLSAVEGLACDGAGNIYIADNTDHRVRKVSASGIITTVAGNGNAALGGDNGPGDRASLNAPYGVAVDASGNLYIADFGNNRIRRVAPDGTIRTIVGGGQIRAPGEGGDALGAQFQGARNVAADLAGNLYISDYLDHRVYRVTPTGQIAVVAGTGVPGNNGDGLALNVRLRFPAGLAIDRSGTLYIADSGNRMVRRLSGGYILTVAGGVSQTISLSAPTGLAVDRDGNLYIADSGASRVYRRSANGAFSTIAGANPPLPGQTRDVCADPLGYVYVADGRRVLRIVPNAPSIVVAGDGTFGNVRDHVDARETYLEGPIGVALDEMGHLYVVEEKGRRVRRITRDGFIHTVANGTALIDPVAVAADGLGALRIAEYQNNRIRTISFSGAIYTMAGDGEPGFSGDGLPAAGARLNRPRGLIHDREGSLYVADSLNHRIRRISPNGFISTVAGTGVRGYYGDGGFSLQAHLNAPLGVATDSFGNLYIADSGNHAIRKVSPAGVISTVAGSGVRGGSGDGGPAILASFNFPSAVAVDSAGVLYIADTFNQRIRRVTSDGAVTTIAGNGSSGFSGDGSLATEAQLRSPTGIAIDPQGNLYVADLDNNRVRKLIPAAGPIAAPVTDPGEEILVMNAASFRTGPVAPGELISITGSRIETQVRFDGRLAPLLQSSADQITVQVPYSVSGKAETEIEVVHQGKARGRARVPVAAAAPGVFTNQSGVGQAFAINEDGTLNSATNPAARGSYVTLYATGEGQTNPAGIDGVPARQPLPRPVLSVSAIVGAVEADVSWAGSAPGFVGLLQINLKLPGIFTPPGVRPLRIRVGDSESQPGVTIAVQ